MASSTGAPDANEVRAAISRVKGLLNRHLVTILKEMRLSHTGVKSTMQARLITQIEACAREGNGVRFSQLRSLIYDPESISSLGNPRWGQGFPATPNNAPNPIGNGAARPFGVTDAHTNPPSAYGRLLFKDSPFFTILEPLTGVQSCPAMQTHRHTVTSSLRLTKNVVDKLAADPALRVMIYCAVSGSLGSFARHDIAFPHQVELKVNLGEVKANFRGLKNKPGSTRPADITSFLRKAENYDNTVATTYALTQKASVDFLNSSFSYIINLVKKHSVEELVDTLRKGRLISKEKVILEMQSRASDSDIVATSTIMSLKCPLSTLRMELPCRSTVCTHNQCFDASSFLQLQEQAPTWTCPICNKMISFEALVVDQYVGDILSSTPKATEQVTIEPNGRWSQNAVPVSPAGPFNNTRHEPVDDDDDDDLLEVRSSTVKDPKSRVMVKTPPSDVRGRHGSDLSANRRASGKRPIEEVVDLTLSDDDGEASRLAKRPTSYSTPSGGQEMPNQIMSTSASRQPSAVQFSLPHVNPRALSATESSDHQPSLGW